MKVIATIGVAALLSMGLAAQASAYSFNPKSASFTGTGPANMTQLGIPVNCTANFTGTTDSSGVGYITGATFSGGLLCPGITAIGLPWTATATSATGGTISGISVKTALGTCGPSTLAATVSSTGVITYSGSLAGSCTISTTGVATSSASSPGYLQIVNP